MEKVNYSIRFSSLDIMRGIAILLMIEAHIKIGTDFLGLHSFCNILAAPFFLIVAGIGYQLFLQSRMKKYSKRFIVFMETFWRALILIIVTTGIFLIGSIIFPTFQYEGIIKWSIFEVIGVGYIFGFFISDSIKKKTISIVAIFMLLFFISHFQIKALFFLTSGVFALIPGISYFIIGQLFYELYKNNNISIKQNQDLIFYSSIFLIINVLILFIFPYEFTRGNRDYFLEFTMISSIFLLLNLLIIRWADLKDKFKIAFKPFENVGKISFTAYYLQWIVYLFPYYSIFNSAPNIANITILIIVFMALALFEREWRKYGYILGLEWILRKVTMILMKKVTFKLLK